MTQESVVSFDDIAASTIVWPNDGKEMEFIPGGTFLMGSNEGNSAYRPEQQLSVTDFYIDRWPVTNAESSLAR